jgi:hypothetical protein
MASESINFDASFLSGIGDTNLNTFYDYATRGLDRVQRRFSALDSKASQTISLLAVVSGILVFAVPSPDLKIVDVKLILYASMVCFIIATLCCLFCLRVRNVLEPGTVGQIIELIHEKDHKRINFAMLSTLIIDIANAERSYITIYDKKSKYLTIGQDFEVVGIILLLMFIGLSKILS